MYGGGAGGMVYYNPYSAQLPQGPPPTTSPTWTDGAGGGGGDVTNIGLHGYQTHLALTSPPHSLNAIHSKQSNCKKLGITTSTAAVAEGGGNVCQKLTKYHPYNSFTLPAHVSERRSVSQMGQRHMRLSPATVHHQEAPVSSDLLFRYAAGGMAGAGLVIQSICAKID